MARKNVKQTKALVTDKKYEGKYVAFDSSKGRKIVAADRNPGKLIEKARKMGIDVPAIVFVPKGNTAYIY
jgi:hypothetical protein